MKFTPFKVFRDAVIVDFEPVLDERGFFSRSFCRNEFEEHGLPADFVQSSVSFSQRHGTLRGMHFQRPPSREGKLIRCTRGAVFDVALDLRPDSPTFLRWEAVELTSDNHRAIYLPPGFAHGMQTLADETELLYLMTDFYAPELSAGVRWNDPAFGIVWPIPAPILSERDAVYPDFGPKTQPRWPAYS
jgi:dTDP-4-dehydrorhamnose 3,5-epimerase